MIAVAAPPPGPEIAAASFRGLNAGNFRRIARNGFGDPHNTYPHAMTWFRDHLYVSTTRDNLVYVKLRYPFEVPFVFWPVPVPGDLWDLDLRARIYRYDPVGDEWDEAYASPMATAPDGKVVPLSIAFRSMTVFQGTSDSAPALYVPTFAPSHLSGSQMLRSVDGTTFDPVSEPGFGVGDWVFKSFRSLVSFKGHLFTAPTMGAQRGKPNDAGVAVVLASADPGRGQWRLANPPNFGNPANATVFEMAPFGEHLYASTFNPREGFELWKTDALGEPPFRWTRVLAQGAHRGQLNQGGVSMAAFKGHLYIGTGVQNGGYDRINKIGPAAPELIRVAPDDSWELIAGQPRVTPDGVKVPLSGMGPGFYNPFSGYFWMMCVHEGWLYVGTFDSCAFLPFSPLTNVPELLRNILERIGIDRLLERWGGFDLWRSRDGVEWVPVSRNGLGNRFNYGIRTMASTPHGLFLGATNPFGPEVAVKRAGGWRYEPNPDGGAEVWMGRALAPSAPVDPLDPGPDVRSPGGPIELQAGAVTADVIEPLIREYYGDSGFRHVGFWRPDVRDARTASENLLEEMLSFLPPSPGPILDVACGSGGSTRVLCRRYGAESVTAVTEDKAELRDCRERVPGADVRRWTPPWLPFRDATFERLVCAEGLAHATRREPLLAEMLRVLRPGGALGFADILFADDRVAAPSGVEGDAPVDRDGYRDLLIRAGFADATVVDVTTETWNVYQGHATQHFGVRCLADEIDLDALQAITAALPGRGRPVAAYVIGVARKAA